MQSRPTIRVLHLAAGNRWTGAAAPAFAEVEALRQSGVEAHYAYVGGYKLEAKLRDIEFAHPLIEKAQNPSAFLRTVTALSDLVRRLSIDVVHAHLTYDHWLARFVARRTGSAIARTFHSRRVLRSDPFTKSVLRATRSVFVINETFLGVPALRGRNARFTPPPVKLAEFTPDGGDARESYGIAPGTPLVMMIGKLSKGRGFEAGLKAFEIVRRDIPEARLMIVGHGEHRPALQQLAAALSLAGAIIWAGYHEDDLAAHYRASDLLLFTARGSDEGHRAVLEAMACGTPAVAAPLEGMSALLGPLEPDLLSKTDAPEQLAMRAGEVLRRPDAGTLRRAVAGWARGFGYGPAAARLMDGYRDM